MLFRFLVNVIISSNFNVHPTLPTNTRIKWLKTIEENDSYQWGIYFIDSHYCECKLAYNISFCGTLIGLVCAYSAIFKITSVSRVHHYPIKTTLLESNLTSNTISAQFVIFSFTVIFSWYLYVAASINSRRFKWTPLQDSMFFNKR